jgi:hypothetical protein
MIQVTSVLLQRKRRKEKELPRVLKTAADILHACNTVMGDNEA